MTIHYKDGSTWKEIDSLYTKVSGVWRIVPRAYIKVSGVWRNIHDKTNFIPAGGIIPYYSTGADPTGWTTYSTANRLLRGWDGTLGDIAGTGGNKSLSFTSVSAANHTGTTFKATADDLAGTPTTWAKRSNNYAAGGHSHAVSSGGTVSNPEMLQARLIQADTAQTNVPANGVVFSSTAQSELTEIAVQDTYLNCSNLATVLAESKTHSFTTNITGNHRHSSYQKISGGKNAYLYVNAGNHSHSFQATDLTWDMVRMCVKAFRKASSFGVAQGMIIGWPNNTPPPGWALCNGANGTLDLRNYFLVIDDTATPGTTRGTGNVTGTYDTGAGGSHEHQSTYYPDYVDNGNMYHGNNVTHSHAGNINQAGNWDYLKLAFIQKT